MKYLVLGALSAFTLSAEIDSRLPVSTVVREDLFAGFMSNDMARFEKGVATLEQLYRERPDQRGEARAWQGDVALYRAVRAYESKKADEGSRFFASAISLFDEALKLGAQNPGVLAISGAGSAYFADRFPANQRAVLWTRAYDAFQAMGQTQMSAVAHLPLHLQGELLAGIAMSAQRTGHQEEFQKALDQMIAVAGSTPYGRAAVAWKERPEVVSKTSLMCKTCHDAGRLEARKAELAK